MSKENRRQRSDSLPPAAVVKALALLLKNEKRNSSADTQKELWDRFYRLWNPHLLESPSTWG